MCVGRTHDLARPAEWRACKGQRVQHVHRLLRQWGLMLRLGILFALWRRTSALLPVRRQAQAVEAMEKHSGQHTAAGGHDRTASNRDTITCISHNFAHVFTVHPRSPAAEWPHQGSAHCQCSARRQSATPSTDLPIITFRECHVLYMLPQSDSTRCAGEAELQDPGEAKLMPTPARGAARGTRQRSQYLNEELQQC
jgi:hypothetical protein